MIVESINISNFRNYSSIHVEFSPGINILFGDNSSGKTNMLEAVFVLCLGRSHRHVSEAVLIKQGNEFYRIEGLILNNGQINNVAVASQKGGKRKITLDKEPLKNVELFKRFCVVTAGPEDSEIISGPPSLRRGFIDIYLSQISIKYISILTEYKKILAQKNAALKRGINPTPFNELLIKSGAWIIKTRQEFLEDIKIKSTEHYENISQGGSFNLEYKPSISIEQGVTSIVEIKAAFEQSINRIHKRERILETSLVGPHRDEVLFTINSFPARNYGSQGEWRTAALSLKLAIYSLIKEKRKTNPVLLLDEVFAELDTKRTKALLKTLKSVEQLFLTTALEPPMFVDKKCTSYNIKNGNIVKII